MVNDDGYYMVNAGQTLLVGGWALPLWNMMEFVNGKDANPYMTWEKNMFQTTNQIISMEVSSWELRMRFFAMLDDTAINQQCPWVKIEGPGADIPSIIIETCCYFGVSSTPSFFINQPMGKGHLWIYPTIHPQSG